MDDEEEINEFVLKDFEFDFSRNKLPALLCQGKRCSGKSYATVALAAKCTHIKRWACWAGTKETGGFWTKKFGSAAPVYYTDDKGLDALKRIMRYQEDKALLYSELGQELPSQYYIGFIFDDITSKKWRAGLQILDELYCNGRHMGIAPFMSSQHLRSVPQSVRLNADYIVLLHNSKRTLKALHEEYIEEPDDFETFSSLARCVTDQRDELGNRLYNCLVYNNNATSDRIDDIFSIMRKSDIPFDQIKLGCDKWREYNSKNYVNHESQDQLRKHKKKERIQRLLKRQEERRQHQIMGLGMAIEPDYYSDDSAEDEVDDTDIISLKKRRGPSIRIVLPKPPPAKEQLALPALDLRHQLPDARQSFSGQPLQHPAMRSDPRMSDMGRLLQPRKHAPYDYDPFRTNDQSRNPKETRNPFDDYPF